ncbi:MAG: glycosyl transferase [Rhodanobacter sp. 68-29]|nr:glycosyltransferase family 39 protein [Rhodanobacter sp.]ODU75676.1 MAG: glycosyl transferase [Rhodanobacter sp. SCN 69-32]OJY56963.1 MAG: glycosyl transferase [Rhodanobacter sp. 68-29]
MTLTSYSRSEHLRSLWPWLPLWTVAALLAIFAHGPMPLYSTRTLAVAWEMWAQHHWLVPHINGEPYSEKAPLLFWLIQAGWAVFGVSDVWPRVLEVIFGGAQLVLISLLARRLFPTRPWMAKAAPWSLLALSYAFLFGLQIMYDVLLAVWTLGALLCLVPGARRTQPRWWLFGVCIGLGLLTKGPVMLLHVLFPWLLGPLWSDTARAQRARWYGCGALAVLLGLAMLLAWAVPAGFSGGDAYMHRLFFSQTAARVVHGVETAEPLQSHARPVLWYVLSLPLLLFPFFGWPRAWVALATLRRPLEPGLRFALCWVLPTFLLFSVIRGKQSYYLLPELAGTMLLMCGAIATLRERRPKLASTAWLGTWPLAVGSLVFALLLFLLPNLVAGDYLHGEWPDTTAPYSRYFAVVFLLLGLLLLLRGRGELRRLAVAGLVGTLALNTLFTLTMWPRYELRPTAQMLGAADQQGRALAYYGSYDGQFHFQGRLTRPLGELRGEAELTAFAKAHPDGLVVEHPHALDAQIMRYALLVQPFRSTWLVVWPATTLAALRSGATPPEPAQPPQVYGADGGRTRAQP